MYETLMGSVAYGCGTADSDRDVYGFCIPPKDLVFPHLAGEVLGFGRKPKRFEQYQQHHILDQSAKSGHGLEYDLDIYSIVKYFQLVMDNNPNMVDSLFTPVDCVLHITNVGQMVRDQRGIFLHKGSYHKFRGYAYLQINRMRGKSEKSKRHVLVEKHGFDTKFAAHTVRLALECEQILEEHTLDLRRNGQMLRAIREGEWTEKQVREWFSSKEKRLEELYETSSLPHSPDEGTIKQLLLDCLEHHYGDLSQIVYVPRKVDQLIKDIDAVIERYRH
jgi:predicted nucleotidyltransferase